MKKKDYLEPTMQVVKLQQQCQILAGSEVGGSMPGTFVEEDLSREIDFDDFSTLMGK